MQSVNLSRRPFVNRRPVLRLAILLWIAGVALSVYNVRQYVGHWQGTANNRQRLAAVNAQVREEQTKLADLDRQLEKVSLERENVHAEFLNRLIAYRTFPWSALFDDLEEVIPLDVKLHSVKPDVNLKAEPEKAKTSRRSRSRRTTSSAARSTAVQPAVDTGDNLATEDAEAPDKEQEQPLRRDEVQLQLNGVAKSEDAVVELIEVLYASPYFRSPFLPGETLNPDGSVSFRISTVYLTRPAGVAPDPLVGEPSETEDPAAPTVAEAAAGELAAAEAGDRTQSAGAPEAPAGASSDVSGWLAVLEDETSAGSLPSAAGEPAAGEPAAGEPAAGDPAASGTAPRGAARRPASRDSTVRARAAGEAASEPSSRDPRRRRRAAVPRSRLGAVAIPGLTPAPALPGSEAPPPAGGAPPAGAPAGTPAGTRNVSQPPAAEAPEFAQPAASSTPAVGPGAWLRPENPWRPESAAPFARREARA